MYSPTRRTVLGILGGGLAGVLGSGVAAARHVPETPRIIFNKQTRHAPDEKPTTVLVQRADLPDGGFVVIHHGQHGDHTHGTGEHHIIGYSDYLEPGHYGGLKIEVSPRDGLVLEGTQTLTATLHRDDGNMEFDHPGGDPHYMNPSGSGPIRDVAEVAFK
ncbi:MAG: hypothetical protein R3324_05385 [Halobacteriales archaeon]|nr:hypothetical protein [Halobacteriales archaeon]